jgi:hypothetical protein
MPLLSSSRRPRAGRFCRCPPRPLTLLPRQAQPLQMPAACRLLRYPVVGRSTGYCADQQRRPACHLARLTTPSPNNTSPQHCPLCCCPRPPAAAPPPPPPPGAAAAMVAQLTRRSMPVRRGYITFKIKNEGAPYNWALSNLLPCACCAQQRRLPPPPPPPGRGPPPPALAPPLPPRVLQAYCYRHAGAAG